MLRKGTCAECGKTARNERSYFCDECLIETAKGKAIAE